MDRLPAFGGHGILRCPTVTGVAIIKAVAWMGDIGLRVSMANEAGTYLWGDRVPFPLPPLTHHLSAFHDTPPKLLSLDRVVHVLNAQASVGVFPDPPRSRRPIRGSTLVNAESAKTSRMSRQSKGSERRAPSVAAGSATTIPEIRIAEGKSGDVGTVSTRPFVAAGGSMPRDKTNTWIATDATIEATKARRPCLRRVATLGRSDVTGGTACCSPSGTVRRRGAPPTGIPHAFGDVTLSVVRGLPGGGVNCSRRVCGSPKNQELNAVVRGRIRYYDRVRRPPAAPTNPSKEH